MTIHEFDPFDDREDLLEQRLRREAAAARLPVPAPLRERTLAVLRAEADPPAPLAFPARRRSALGRLSALAAMIALAAMALIMTPQPGDRVATSDDVRQVSTLRASASHAVDRVASLTAKVRFAALVQPLEREAENLQSDLQRFAERFGRGFRPFDRAPATRRGNDAS